MIFGFTLISSWFWFLANYQLLNIHVIKEMLLLFGIGLILTIIELIAEVKIGFKLIFKFLYKVLSFPFKRVSKKNKIKKIQRKVQNGMPLTKRELTIWKTQQSQE